VIQFKILSGKMAGHYRVARHFPFQIGRKTGVDLQLEDAGVWDKHLTVQLAAGAEFQFETQSGLRLWSTVKSLIRAVCETVT